jgi:hypothetical protein
MVNEMEVKIKKEPELTGYKEGKRKYQEIKGEVRK